MSEIRHCAACGAPLPAQVVADTACPACLVRLALHVEPEEEGAAPGANTPAGGTDQPRRVGPYEILEVLCEGGICSVYLAEQREPIWRRIALKIVKRGMDSAADGLMYVVTAESILGEEGTMGYTSALTGRPNTAHCP